MQEVRVAAAADDARRRRVVLLRPLEEGDRSFGQPRGSFVPTFGRGCHPGASDRPVGAFLVVLVVHVERLHGKRDQVLDSVLNHDAAPVEVVGSLRAGALDLVQESIEGPGLVGGQGVEHDRVHLPEDLLDAVVVDVVGSAHQIPEGLDGFHALKLFLSYIFSYFLVVLSSGRHRLLHF